MNKRLQSEQFWMYLSLCFNVVCVVAAGIIGVHVDSSVLIFDAIYSTIGALSYLLLLFYNTKIYNPPTKEFQFGYNKLEPLLIVTQTILIVFSCIYALLSSIRDIIHAHLIKSFMEVALLECILGSICIVLWFGCYRGAKRYDSNLLRVQAWVWVMDCIQSVIIGSAFFIAHYLKTTKYYWITPYIDPIATIGLVLTIIRLPIIVFYENLLDLLDKSINPRDLLHVDKALQEMMAHYGTNFQVDSLITRKAGGKIFIIVLCKNTTNISIKDLAQIKDLILAALGTEFYSIDIKFAV
jgi:predicted Co/Zn/Cd cation transporter (cation efflux family)